MTIGIGRQRGGIGVRHGLELDRDASDDAAFQQPGQPVLRRFVALEILLGDYFARHSFDDSIGCHILFCSVRQALRPSN